MKSIISVVIFLPTLQIFVFSVVPFNFKCPLQAHWKMRAEVKCNSTSKYFCLFNNVEGIYVEGCDGPDWDRKGCKRIYAGDFTRANCTRERFQPFKFRTNESMSDCIYSKSICSENGQIVYIDDSRKYDRTCRCDYKRNYSFVKTPRHLCYCIPTEEDCSCYIKSCPTNFNLSAVTGAFSLAVLFLGCASEKPHGINHTGSCETSIVSDADVTVVTRIETLITDDMVDGNNHESSADRTHGNGSLKAGLERVDVHEPSIFGKTVTSDGFDIRLMIYLLGSLANIEVGDLYPVQSDSRVSAMLSRIKYIRNEATQSYAGKLSEDQFNKYWDDIAQAVLKLVSPKDIREDQEKNQFISRLQTLNPIDIDNDKVCVYISLSEKYPADILKQIITEYCATNEQILEDILKKEKHELYHKRIITESCCVCSDKQFCTYIKVIQEKQWETLYEMKEGADSHSCLCSVKKCSERFVPKTVDTSDLSVTVPLVLFIPDILTYIINQLYGNKFDTF
ncbi:unnamed protein product [Mytilus edulis]|uniref:DZIP3-like HEPN domain-containing protein n=1 Tax=Mytilus edulis TaxID=6550 RepID=A0A8S3RP12_MYTED|nr:unnamed protein product [Mytilus edulis]